MRAPTINGKCPPMRAHLDRAEARDACDVLMEVRRDLRDEIADWNEDMLNRELSLSQRVGAMRCSRKAEARWQQARDAWRLCLGFAYPPHLLS